MLAAAKDAHAFGVQVPKGNTVTGYLMDNFCIRHGTLLDHRGVATLQHPEMHTCVRLNGTHAPICPGN